MKSDQEELEALRTDAAQRESSLQFLEDELQTVRRDSDATIERLRAAQRRAEEQHRVLQQQLRTQLEAAEVCILGASCTCTNRFMPNAVAE